MHFLFFFNMININPDLMAAVRPICCRPIDFNCAQCY